MDKIQREINELEALDRSEIAKGRHAWFEDSIEDLKEGLDLKNKRKHLLNLYNNPDWMLQAGMGDIEHEQFMYDQLTYGKPAVEALTEDDYRAIPFYEDINESGWGQRSGYLGLADSREKNIDLNLDMILDDWQEYQNLLNASQRDLLNPNEMKGVTSMSQDPAFSPVINFLKNSGIDKNVFSLQNAIADLYRHEYGHLNPKLMGNKFEHPVIYANEFLKGQYLPNVIQGGMRCAKGPESYGETYGGMPARMAEPKEDYISFQGRDPHDRL